MPNRRATDKLSFSISNSSLSAGMELLVERFPSCVLDVTNELNVTDIKEQLVTRGMKTIKDIMRHFHMRDMQREHRNILLRCSLYSVYYFWDKQDLVNIKMKSIDPYEDSTKCFKTVVNFLADAPEELVDSAIQFVEQFNLWKYSTYSCDVFNTFAAKGFNKVYTKLTDIIIHSKTKHSRQDILNILYSIVKYVTPKNEVDDEIFSVLHMTVIQFLEMFLSDLDHPQRAGNLPMSALLTFLKRICQKVTKRALFTILSKLIVSAKSLNYEKVDLYSFGLLTEFVADLYKPEEFLELDADKLFRNVLKLITSDNPHMSNIACRVFQHLLDRKGNRRKLKPLKIYFDFLKTDLKVAEMDDRDVIFMDRHKIVIVSSFTASISQHSHMKAYFDDWFCCIALISIEIPCGLTAAWTGWICMKIQEIGLKEQLTDLATRHAMHVLTISILSLICWVHRSQPLYDYVRKVAANRSGSAPHLNPPIRQQYEYPQYHITWDKPDLFFDEWELRYSLWKTFGVLKTAPQYNGMAVVDSYLA